MKKIIFSFLAFSLPTFVFAQKSFLDKTSLIVTTGYSSPEGKMSNFNSGSIAFNVAIAYNLSNSTQTVLNFRKLLLVTKNNYLRNRIYRQFIHSVLV